MLHQSQHLAGPRVPAKTSLGEHQSTIDADLEDSARRLHQLELRSRESLPQFGDQTGRPGFIVSDDAVFDRDLHGATLVSVEPR